MTGDVAPAAGDPQALGRGGLSWSGWLDFDKAHRGHLIPATPGIYRFRARDEPGLLYTGESGDVGGRRARLGDLARGTQAQSGKLLSQLAGGRSCQATAPRSLRRPYMRHCEDAGGHVEVSWALEEHPEKTERRAAEARLIRLHREVVGVDPPIQTQRPGDCSGHHWPARRHTRDDDHGLHLPELR